MWPGEPTWVSQRDVAAEWSPLPWQELGLHPVRLEVRATATVNSAWAGADLGRCPAYPRPTSPMYPVKEPFLQRLGSHGDHSSVCWEPERVWEKSTGFQTSSDTWKTAALRPREPQCPHLRSRNDAPSFRWSLGELNKKLMEG